MEETYLPIVNNEALLEDMAEGIANILDVSMLEIIPKITDHMIDEVLNVMFEAESEELHRIANEIKTEKII